MSEDHINQTLEILADEGPEKGVIIGKKCELWSNKSLSSLDQTITKMGNGFEVLGAAICSKGFIASYLTKRVQKVLSMLDNLTQRSSMFIRCLLLLLGNSKLVYSLQIYTPSNELLEVFNSFDHGQKKYWINLLAQWSAMTNGNNHTNLSVCQG